MKKILIIFIACFMIFNVVACSTDTDDGEDAQSTVLTKTEDTKENDVKTEDEVKEEAVFVYANEAEKFKIEKVILDSFNEGDYNNVVLNKYTINENAGTNDENTYIVLVYFDFNVLNKSETGNKVMRLYSDDLSATFANAGLTDIAEIAIFWEDEYNDRSLKYAYEYDNDNDGFYISDIAGE